MLQDSLRISTPNTNTLDQSSRTVLIYLIPGNPGLIEYYRQFLDHLANTLQSHEHNTQYEICGDSLSGFELNTHDSASSKRPPYSLDDQISLVHRQLNRTVSDRCRSTDKKTAEKLPVILIGHSVGAYILLEILAQRQRAQIAKEVDADDDLYEIVGGTCLFPTVVDIAKSPSGKIAAPLLLIPGLPLLIHYLAKLLCSLLSTSTLSSVIKRVTKMPDAAAETTLAFLRSRYGVHQALYMAHHELRQIARDKWDDHIWGGNDSDSSLAPSRSDSASPLPQSTRSKDVRVDKPHLDFYWAEQDHWVDNSTRDGLIAKRARQVGRAGDEGGSETRPRMEIETRGVPHAFCLRHSEPVAEKVAEYIGDIVRT